MELRLKLLAKLALVACIALYSCKKDKDSDDETTPDGGTPPQKVLIIDVGAQTLNADQTFTYTARFIDIDGTITTATNVTWSSSSTDIFTINSSGLCTPVGMGTGKVTASVTENGFTFTAVAPIGITIPSLFSVAPSAIIYEKGGTLDLTPIYIGIESPSYTYSSSDASVASVSASGKVTFESSGECVITVTADLDGSPTVEVPVLVIPGIEIPLPVTKVEVTPTTKEIFRGQTASFTAKAFNSDNEDVTSDVSFQWTTTDPTIATVDANGTVTGKSIGTTQVISSAEGLIAQAEIHVSPDTVVLVDPFFVSVGQGNSTQLTAKAYRYDGNNLNELTGVTNFKWETLSYGIPAIDNLFSIGSISSSGMFTVKSDAAIGNNGMAIAYIPNTTAEPGVAMIMVAIADDCDCGTDDPNITEINVAKSTLNLSLFGTMSETISATDQNGDPIDNSDLTFCSDNVQVASVDFTGAVNAGSAQGTANITVCAGSVKTKVTVNVTF